MGYASVVPFVPALFAPGLLCAVCPESKNHVSAFDWLCILHQHLPPGDPKEILFVVQVGSSVQLALSLPHYESLPQCLINSLLLKL